MLWQGLERFGINVVQLIVSVILARLLAPSDFGLVALVMIFIGFADTFVDGGFRMALIQRKNLSETDCSSVFWMNLGVGFLLGIGLYTTAPWIASFYGRVQIIPLLRVMAIVPVLNGLTIVQSALLSRQLKFKQLFQARILALLCSAGVGIGMAYGGYGVWALIGQRMVNVLATSLSLYFILNWLPKFQIDLRALGEMFKYGSSLLAASLLNFFSNALYTLIIGKCFSVSDLGYYNRGQTYPKLAVDSLNQVLGNVMFPVFSQIQQDREQIRMLMRQTMMMMMFLLVPILGVLLVAAEPFIRILLTAKWLGAVIFLQIACLQFFFFPIHIFNIQVMRAVGRSDLNLLVEIIKKVIMVLIIIVTMRWGIVAMAWGAAINSFLGILCHTWISKRLIDYGTFAQIRDLLPTVFTAVIAGFASWGCQLFVSNDWLKLGITGSVFLICYLGLNFLGKTDSMMWAQRIFPVIKNKFFKTQSHATN